MHIHLARLGQRRPTTWCGLSRDDNGTYTINPNKTTCPECLTAYWAEVPEEQS